MRGREVRTITSIVTVNVCGPTCYCGGFVCTCTDVSILSNCRSVCGTIRTHYNDSQQMSTRSVYWA